MIKKGFQRFQTAAPEKTFQVNAGVLALDKKVKDHVQNVFKRYSNKDKYGDKALKTEGEAVSVLLEHFIYKERRACRRRVKTK